jgi:hypothetical protein
MEASTSDEGGNLTMGVNGGLRVQGCWRTLAGNVRQNVDAISKGPLELGKAGRMDARTLKKQKHQETIERNGGRCHA